LTLAQSRALKIGVNVFLSLLLAVSVVSFLGNIGSYERHSSRWVGGIATIASIVCYIVYYNWSSRLAILLLAIDIVTLLFSVVFLHGQAYREIYPWILVGVFTLILYYEVRDKEVSHPLRIRFFLGGLKRGDYSLSEKFIARRLGKDPGDYMGTYLKALVYYFQNETDKSFNVYKDLLASGRTPLQHQRWFLRNLIGSQEMLEQRKYKVIEIRARQVIPLTRTPEWVKELEWWLWHALYYQEKFSEMIDVIDRLPRGLLNKAEQRIIGRVRSYGLLKIDRNEEAIAEVDSLLPDVSKTEHLIELLKYKCEALYKIGRNTEALEQCQKLRELGVTDDFVRSYEELAGGTSINDKGH